MPARRRRRVRAADLAPNRSRKSLVALGGVAAALSILILYKTHVGDDATQLLEALGVDPGLMLPPSVTLRSPEGVLSEGSLLSLGRELAKAAMGCAQPGDLARLQLQVRVDRAGDVAVEAAEADRAATVHGQLLACVQGATLRVAPPLGGPARHALMVPVWRPANLQE